MAIKNFANALLDNKMLTEKCHAYSLLYRKELEDNILPFWLKYSPDRSYGGYFSCLNRDGSVYDHDKFLWMQGREVWCFAKMYAEFSPNPQWKEMSLLGGEFLRKYGRDKNGNWYFSLSREGQPLVQPYNIFSDCFAAMGLGALEKIEPGLGYGEIAVATFSNIIKRMPNPKGSYNKIVPETRPLKSFALPMILCNLSLELEHLLGPDVVDSLTPSLIKEVMDVFYQPELGLIVENVNIDGSLSDSFEGRSLNPGHAIEAMWFIMSLGRRLHKPDLIEKACNIMLHTLEFAWDKQYGGLFYFMDRKGVPVQQLEWDQKLWWVHMETLVALSIGFAYSGNAQCFEWFEKVHEYTWAHFRDEEFGEWFGYLNRRGEPLLTLKGGKWKGCFHIPRALFQISKTFGSI